MQLFFKIFAAVFSALFVWAVVIQFNDNDPWVWILVYLIAALTSVAFILNKLSFPVAISLVAIYFLAGFLHWPDSYQGLEIKEVGLKNVKQGREAIGLFICGLIILIYALRIHYKKVKLPHL